MDPRVILYPVFAQVVLTLVVYVLLSVAKARAVARGEVPTRRKVFTFGCLLVLALLGIAVQAVVQDA